ncbi:glycosyltransferase family 2 protein [Fodinicola acaciae]|uniref:glycosyltransferase family 2 protein n=1 Tax=Fodinicola acaciae TaxID=2681555 RepID=UPI001C9E44E7|nr:glycosyltransferase [Fodinicola acaciae]
MKIASTPVETTDLTVVIATRNRRAELLRTLSRLVGRVAVIVIDNGSRDGTVAAVAETYPSVRLVALPKNRGSAARNIGVEFATTPYVAFSDDDSWWEPGALARAARVLDGHPELGLIASREAGAPASPRGSTPCVPITDFLACTTVVRRDAFLAVGGFSPVLFLAAEEMLLSYDLAAAGYSLSYVDSLAVRRAPVRRTPGAVRRRLELRNQLLISWMRRPLGRAFADLLRLGRSAVVSTDALVAFGSALVRLPWAVANRRPLPRQVETEILRLEAEAATA